MGEGFPIITETTPSSKGQEFYFFEKAKDGKFVPIKARGKIYRYSVVIEEIIRDIPGDED